jgi:hypothetical protein
MWASVSEKKKKHRKDGTGKTAGNLRADRSERSKNDMAQAHRIPHSILLLHLKNRNYTEQ